MANPGKYTQLTDAELVAAYKSSKDQQYLAALYERYAGLLFGVCLKYLQSAELARDACTDIYEELVSKLLKHEVETFRSWLHVLAKNHCLQKLRTGKKAITVSLTAEIVQSGDGMHLEEVMQKEAHLKQMEYCLDQLNTDQKKMVELFYLQEKCYNDIVTITGMPWNTVRSNIQNGRRNLKLCMEQQASG